MDKLELLLDTFKGKNERFPLVSLWKHFPHEDKNPEKLAEAHYKFYEHHKFDLMKISPHGRYSVVDFGCQIDEQYDPITGSTKCKNCRIKAVDDWQSIDLVDVHEGELGKQIRTVKLISKKLEDLPKMMTVFSPLMTASKMDSKIVNSLRTEPELLIESLYTLEEVTLEFAFSSLDAGAQGIFLASQHLRKTELSWEETKRFEIAFLKRIISKLKKQAEFIVLHIHGQEIYFKEVIDTIQVDALNWHDQLTWPSIDEGAKMFKKGLLAGIDETHTLVEGKIEEIQENIAEAYKMSEKNQNKVIIAPGCVIPITVSNEALEVVTSTIKKHRKRG
ncbi:MAG: uroporphyrinogen decarboxylase family protein [Candidatus Heimdallarchaeaceae archaeon]